MWDLPGPGIEPVSPALAGGFLTTAPEEEEEEEEELKGLVTCKPEKSRKEK